MVYNYHLLSSHISQLTSDMAFYNHLTLHISVYQLFVWPSNDIHSVHTQFQQRQTCPGNIVCGQHTSECQHLKFLPASFVATTQQRINITCDNTDRGLVENVLMSIQQKNKKSVKRPSCMTTYSYILHHLFSIYLPQIIHSFEFHSIKSLYNYKTSSI